MDEATHLLDRKVLGVIRLITVAAALVVSACASQPTAPRVITQHVEIPVAVPVEAPARLKECGRKLPIPEFGQAPAGKPYALTLSESNARKLQEFGDTVVRCLRGWRVWEMEQRLEPGGRPE